jgi:hypothetical protein
MADIINYNAIKRNIIANIAILWVKCARDCPVFLYMILLMEPWHSIKPEAHEVARKSFLPLQGEGQDGDGFLRHDEPIPTPTLPLKGRELPSFIPYPSAITLMEFLLSYLRSDHHVAAS